MIDINTTTDARIDSLPAFSKIACPNLSLFADQHRHLTLDEIREEADSWADWSRECGFEDLKKRARNFARKYSALHRELS